MLPYLDRWHRGQYCEVSKRTGAPYISPSSMRAGELYTSFIPLIEPILVQKNTFGALFLLVWNSGIFGQTPFKEDCGGNKPCLLYHIWTLTTHCLSVLYLMAWITSPPQGLRAGTSSVCSPMQPLWNVVSLELMSVDLSDSTRVAVIVSRGMRYCFELCSCQLLDITQLFSGLWISSWPSINLYTYIWETLHLESLMVLIHQNLLWLKPNELIKRALLLDLDKGYLHFKLNFKATVTSSCFR